MSENDEQIPQEMSDAELVRAAKSGRLQAFGELVERSQGLARAVAFSASGDVANVEDLVQEALVTAWTRLSDLSDPAAFRPWLAGIVRNTVRYWRRHQRRHAPRAQAGMDTLSQLASSAPSPLDQAEWQQDWQHTQRALQSLPEKYREPLVLYYSLGESHAQVAEALGLTEASARQRVHRARKKLTTEVSTVASGGRRLAARASAAAGVMLVIKRREAWASAPTAPALTSAVGPKLFLGLGALGGAAMVACIAAFVMLIGGERDSIGSTNAVLAAPQPPSQHAAENQDSAATPIVAPAAVVAEEQAMAVEGLVRIGRGKVADKQGTSLTSGVAGQAVFPTEEHQAKNISYNDKNRTSERLRKSGRIKKHGPAVLQPKEEEKPLMTPDIDMRAVNRELWQ